MSDPFADALGMVDDWERNAAEKAAKFQVMADRVAEVTITESVADGAVSATVGSNGLPTNIAMTERVRRMSPDEIAGHVMAAIRKAQSRYPEALAEIVAETVGDDPAGQHILDTAKRNFPVPDQEESSTAGETGRRIGDVEDDNDPADRPVRPSRRPSRARDEDDGDFGDESLFR